MAIKKRSIYRSVSTDPLGTDRVPFGIRGKQCGKRRSRVFDFVVNKGPGVLIVVEVHNTCLVLVLLKFREGHVRLR